MGGPSPTLPPYWWPGGQAPGLALTAAGPDGLDLRHTLEETTDHLAAPPFGVLHAGEADEALASARSVARAVAEGGDIPFPNPMGLPAPGAA